MEYQNENVLTRDVSRVLVKKSETLQLLPNLDGVQKYAWSGSLCLESEEWSRFTVK